MRVSMPLLKRVGVAMLLIGLAGGSTVLFRYIFAPDDDHLTSMLVRWGSPPAALDYDSAAQYDLIGFSAGAWRGPAGAARADSLRKRNVDIRLGQYFPVMALGQWIVQNPTDPWNRDYLAAVAPYLAWTDEGDTAALFMANYTLNITIPECRAAIIAFFTDPERLGPCDWFFLDFFTIPMPDLKVTQPPAYQLQENGDMDLDGDGICHWDDLDEQELLRASFFAYVQELRAALPTNRIPGKFLLIANGQLAVQDSNFAALLDGVFLEGFPRYSGGFDEMLDPANPRGLASLCRRLDYVVLDDYAHTGDYGLLASLWDNAVDGQIWPDKSTVMPIDASRKLEWLGKPMSPAWNDSAGWHRVFDDGYIISARTSCGELEIWQALDWER